MRTVLKVIGLLIIFGSLVSCGEQRKNQSEKIDTPKEIEKKKEKMPETTDASFQDGMTGKMFENYLHLQMALVNSDPKGAKRAAGNLAEGFTSEEGQAQMKSIAQQIAGTDNLEEQRKLYSDFTSQVEQLLSANLSSGTIYRIYCPMAFDNKGAYWLSEVKEIRTPYLENRCLSMEA